MADNIIWSVSDVAKRYDCHTETVLRWIRSGDLVASRYRSGSYRILEKDIRDYIKQTRNDPPSESCRCGGNHHWLYCPESEPI